MSDGVTHSHEDSKESQGSSSPCHSDQSAEIRNERRQQPPAQLSPVRQAYPTAPVGVGNEAQPPPVPMNHETDNIPNFQPQTQLPSGLQLQGNSTYALTEPTYEIQGPTTGFANYRNPMGRFGMQTDQLPNPRQTLQRGVSGFYRTSFEIGESSSRNAAVRSPIPFPTTHQTLQRVVPPGSHPTSFEIGESSSMNARVMPPMQIPLIPNTHQTLQRGVPSFHPSRFEVGESSSRNVRRRITIEEPQQGSSPVPPVQVNRNPSPPRALTNRVYDPSFAMQGLPVDPHLRVLLFLRNRNQPW